MAWEKPEWLDRKRHWLAATLIALAALAAYANCFSGAFLFDDESSIENNKTIRSLWPISRVLRPLEGGLTVAGRPVVNLTLAFNYAIGGLQTSGYHALNLAIHISAALLLYGFVRRTLLRPGLRESFGKDSGLLALAVAVLWVLHPLQTESVTYIIQRAEALGALFYLLTLYCFLRGVDGNGSKVWPWMAVAACAVGMGCKETMVSAPLLVLLYDRTLVAGSFREALRQRWMMYATMAATWLLLAYFVVAAGQRGNSADMGLSATTLDYARTQCHAIVKYLGLIVWPHPLVFDYGAPMVIEPARYLPQGVILLLLAALAVVGVIRRTLWGFLLCWFFAVLAPSSSVVVISTQTMAEHRMYLPLAAILLLVVLAVYQWLGRRSVVLWIPVAVVLGSLTFLRNKDYVSGLTIWADTVQKCPTNMRALNNLGTILLKAGQSRGARELCLEAVRLNPNYIEPRMNLGIILCQEGRMKEGLEQFRSAVQLNPNNAKAQANLGMALYGMGEWKEARSHFEAALRIDPENSQARQYLENVRGKEGAAL